MPYVGEAYIKAEREHFKYADSCFKANPEDEIAAGFDFDRWAGGQNLLNTHTNGILHQKINSGLPLQATQLY